jgi:hypothetical protein
MRCPCWSAVGIKAPRTALDCAALPMPLWSNPLLRNKFYAIVFVGVFGNDFLYF